MPGSVDCQLQAPVFINQAERRDVVIDDLRCRAYVSTTSGTVYRYEITTGELAPLADFGTALTGIDLSPDRSTLVVADTATQLLGNASQSRVHLINLNTLAQQTFHFSLQSLESGTYMPLFVANDRFLLTSDFAGSGTVPLRSVSVANGAATTLRMVDQETMLALSADGSTVAYVEPNNSGGPFGRITLADGSFHTESASWFLYEVSVNRNATQFAVPLYGGLYIYGYQNGFGQPTNIGVYTSHYGLGVAYSPNADILFVSWTDAFETKTSIEALDSKTLTPLFTLDDHPAFVHAGNYALVSGRLRIAKSGNLLAATVTGGVKIYPTRAPSGS